MHPALCPAITSEDCLTLNVYAPLTATNTSALPVIFWIFGGGNTVGSAGVDAYDGGPLAAAQSVVVVTVNYRLGVLGYLALDGVSSGQMGVLDQRLAMQWVHSNIAAFGGDPSRVTLWGWSAGADSVLFHLVSEGSWPYFHAAILTSNSGGNEYFTVQQGNAFAELFAAAAGCAPSNTTCFTALSTSDIVVAQTNASSVVRQNGTLSISMPWAPYIDGIELVDTPMELVAQGRFSRVPVVFGNASSEQHMYVYGSYTTPQSQAVFDDLVSSIFTPMYAPLVEARYPVDNSTSPVDSRPQINDVKSDFIYVCPNRRFAALASFHMPGQVYTYWFNHSYEEYDSWGPYSPYCWGVCHL
jgi:carboxylesterase type B